jgi:hypothetical protein
MNHGGTRKTARKPRKTSGNHGPEKSARVYRVGNPSGLENLDLPKGREEDENDSAITEKQNQ